MPNTPAAFGTPLHIGPIVSAATNVPIVLAPTIVVLVSATPANSARIDLRRSSRMFPCAFPLTRKEISTTVPPPSRIASADIASVTPACGTIHGCRADRYSSDI